MMLKEEIKSLFSLKNVEGTSFENFYDKYAEEYQRLQKVTHCPHTKTIKVLHENFHKFEKNVQQSTAKGLTIFHQNVDRISNKIERMNHLLHHINPEILVVSEHGQNKSNIVNTRLMNYSLVSAFSRENVIKGGVAIYKQEGLSTEIASLDIEHLSTPLVCEVTAISVVIDRRSNLYILGVYRPPRKDKDSFSVALKTVSTVLDGWVSSKNTIVIVGDFNVDSLELSTERTKLEELLMSYNISRLNLPPTRITKETSSSIDMFCISSENLNEVDFQVACTGISDHTGQFFRISTKTRINSTVTSTRRRINNKTIRDLKDQLSAQDWETVFECANSEEAYNSFITTLTFSLNSTCPLVKARVRPCKSIKQVFDAEAGQLKAQFLSAVDTFTMTGRREDKEMANDLKRSYDMKLRSLRKEASATYIADSSNKSRAVWKVINSERQQKREPCNLVKLVIDGVVVSDPVVISNEFNHYFTSIAEVTLENIKDQKTNHVQSCDWQIDQLLAEFAPTSMDELLGVIRGLNNKTSTGFDEVSSLMLKQCQYEFVRPMLHIINKSFQEGHVPSKMKLSKVIPLHKAGSKTELENYRPISLVSTFSKLMEKIVFRRIVEHLERNNIVLEEQHGFTWNKSTSTALVSLFEHMIDKLEAGDNVMGIFLDLSKAFDCLSHDLILTKLNELGFRDAALMWLQSYLTGREQVVEIKQNINGTHTVVRSEKLPVSRGVPQGSVLGPLLFVLFTADFPAYTKSFCKTIMYADDTVLLMSCKSKEDLEIRSYIALNMAVEYCNKNDLVFNGKKTKQLNFGAMKEEVSALPNIECVEALKHLGVVIDSSLSWSDHLDGLCSKLSTAIFALRRVKSVSTTDAVRITYSSLFESHLRYGIVLWGAASQVNLNRVLIIQKRAIRILAGLDVRESCRRTFTDLNILTVVNIYLLEVICLANSTNLKRNQSFHTYSTRNAQDFNLAAHHTTRFQQKPTYAGAKLFNVLPMEVKRSCLDSFKKTLLKWLIERPFYSIAEFLDWPNFQM